MEEGIPRRKSSICTDVHTELGITKTRNSACLINLGQLIDNSSYRQLQKQQKEATRYLTTWMEGEFVENTKIMMLPWSF